jgi:propanol-preferring alcohol dehydrogenase
VNASTSNPGEIIKKEIGGAHGVVVSTVSLEAFEQALSMTRRKGTVVLTGLPPGDFPLPIFNVVLNRITVRGSIVGTRKDLQEALDFAKEGLVKANIDQVQPLEAINDIFTKMRNGTINGRIVMTMN